MVNSRQRPGGFCNVSSFAETHALPRPQVAFDDRPRGDRRAVECGDASRYSLSNGNQMDDGTAGEACASSEPAGVRAVWGRDACAG
jgi:hypothetical protein